MFYRDWVGRNTQHSLTALLRQSIYSSKDIQWGNPMNRSWSKSFPGKWEIPNSERIRGLIRWPIHIRQNYHHDKKCGLS